MWNFVIWIGTSILSYLLQPTPENAKPAALSDFNVPTADPNRNFTVVFGSPWIEDPNVVWYGDLRADPIRSSGGGKGK
jgi:hypothetical protein